MSLLEVAVQTQADRKLVDGLLEIFDTGMAHPSQIEIFRKILLCLLDAPVDVLMSLLPILEIQMDNSSVIEQVRTVRIKPISYLHVFQGIYQGLCHLDIIFILADIEPINMCHCDVDIRLYFLRIDACRFLELTHRLPEIMNPIR